MLIRFVVNNYLSFGEEVEFNMLTSSQRRLKEHIYSFEQLELLKVAAIFGANGAGKSNLVKAMDFLQRFVTTGQTNLLMLLEVFRLDKNKIFEPHSFEIEFIQEGQSYSYGLVLNEDTILEEWLYLTHFGKRDTLLFNRIYQENRIKIEVNQDYYETAEDKMRIKLYEEELLAENYPLIRLFASAKQGFELIKQAYSWFEKQLVILFPHSKSLSLLELLLQKKVSIQLANEFVKALKTGVEQLDINTYKLNTYFGKDDKEKVAEIKKLLQKQNNKASSFPFLTIENGETIIATLENNQAVVKKLSTKHLDKDGQGVDFDLKEESSGTMRLFELIPAFLTAIQHNATVIIDEIDQSIHPYLLKQLLTKFLADNATKGQFIFTTHEAYLLDQDIFRRDEIWFMEKNKNGSSHIYPLSDFNIRYDLNIQKGYFNGRFGALPTMSHLKKLNWDYAKTK